MQKYADERSVHQYLIFLEAPHSMHCLPPGPALYASAIIILNAGTINTILGIGI
jgi:hypothetical protein